MGGQFRFFSDSCSLNSYPHSHSHSLLILPFPPCSLQFPPHHSATSGHSTPRYNPRNSTKTYSFYFHSYSHPHSPLILRFFTPSFPPYSLLFPPFLLAFSYSRSHNSSTLSLKLNLLILTIFLPSFPLPSSSYPPLTVPLFSPTSSFLGHPTPRHNLRNST